MEMLFEPQVWISLLTLSLLEIILGVDNIVVISILTSKLPQEQQAKGRSLGITLALLTRMLLLLFIAYLAKLTAPLFTISEFEFSIRDLIMLLGGLFLLWKGTKEIHHLVEGLEEIHAESKKPTMTSIIIQIGLFDLIFSLDSVITAVGIGTNIPVMIAAIIIAMVVMLLASGKISDFIEKHISIKMLALSFLILIGVTLIAEGFKFHIPKPYIYFAMGFSGLVEILTIIAAKKKKNHTAH